VDAALSQSWPPFVLIIGLLLVGLVASRDGVFAWGGACLRRTPGGPGTLLAAALALVAIVTAVLNLDTAVVFLTPVLVLAARERGLRVEPFLYGCVFMANASSLFLPGSNLTNLLVLSDRSVSGSAFASQLFPEAATAAVVTGVAVALLYRSALRPGGARIELQPPFGWPPLSLGLLATIAVAVLVLVLRQPALPVLGVGVAAVAAEIWRRELSPGRIRRVVGPLSLGAAFVLTVAFGTLARDWSGPSELLSGASSWETAAVAALSAVAINNLPAAALYSAHPVAHAQALLLGLNVGPNLAATGALSALLWYRTAEEVGERPSLWEFSRRGLILAPVAIAAALLAGSVF
jgi:arsenical pump membrane protein